MINNKIIINLVSNFTRILNIFPCSYLRYGKFVSSKLTFIVVLLVNIVPIFTLQMPADAQSIKDSSAAAHTVLPNTGMLRPGKIVRDAAGIIVLQKPSCAVECADPGARDDALPPSASMFVTESIGENVADLPPPAKLKAGVMQRSDAGDLTLAPHSPQELRVCKPQTAMPDCNFLSLADALAAAQPGDTILLSTGVYEEAALVTVANITIHGDAGAHLKGRAVEGKAALVIRADDILIEGIECSEIRVPDKNGACVRIEGRNLTLRNVYFHDNEEGVLGGVGGTVLVEDSVFERNGANAGYAHGLYIAPGVEKFIFRRNKVLSTKLEGQGVKSRAQKTIIENSVIAGLASRDSRAIDIPNGGDIEIRGNVLQKGPDSSNSQMIGLGLEGNLHPGSRALIEDNLIIFDDKLPSWVKIINDTIPIASASGTAVYSRMPNVMLKNNAIIGVPRTFEGEGVAEDNTRRYPTRSRANLPEYPALPDPGVQLNPRPN